MLGYVFWIPENMLRIRSKLDWFGRSYSFTSFSFLHDLIYIHSRFGYVNEGCVNSASLHLHFAVLELSHLRLWR